MTVKFKATRKESQLIALIADRTERYIADLHRGQDYRSFEYSRQDMLMDLEAVHSNGCPLDFEKLLSFDDFNFVHDVLGIRANINRETGALENCFWPRCAQK